MKQIWVHHRMGPQDIFQILGFRKPTVKRGTPVLRITHFGLTSGTQNVGVQYNLILQCHLTWQKSVGVSGVLVRRAYCTSLSKGVSCRWHWLQTFYGYKDIGYIDSKSNLYLLQQSRNFPQKTLDWALGWVRPSLFPFTRTIQFCYVCESVSSL